MVRVVSVSRGIWAGSRTAYRCTVLAGSERFGCGDGLGTLWCCAAVVGISRSICGRSCWRWLVRDRHGASCDVTPDRSVVVLVVVIGCWWL